MWRLPFSLLLALLFALPGLGNAQTIDPHAVFEQRCSRCHTEHGGAFARKTLVLNAEDKVVGKKTNQPLAAFLPGHPGGATASEIDALLDMFAMQLRSGGLYARKCRICHKNAKELTRARLEVRDGQLFDHISERNIPEFLKGHGRLTAQEIPVIERMLKWQIEVTPR